MKVKITTANVPVEERHGITYGRVFEVVDRRGGNVWVMGDAGERVKLWRREWVAVELDKTNDTGETTT